VVGIYRRKCTGQQIRLLLVIPFQANPVARPDYRLQQGGGVASVYDLALC
jgi:hypothetical protein